MAKRPVFLPDTREVSFVRTIDVEFKWFPGFAKSQRQKSIDSLHQAANSLGYAPILEISGKSKSPLGVSLSAFNLKLRAPHGQVMSVECAYQGSKVFEKGGAIHRFVPCVKPKGENRRPPSDVWRITQFSL